MTTIAESVRPQTWDDFIGQHRMKSRLETKIQAAANDGRSLDHTFLVAPPGAGKSTLAALIADQLDDQFAELVMPMKLMDFFDFVEEFEWGVILLDELHAAPRQFQEALQPALVDGIFRSTYGLELDARAITFIGATTTAFRSGVLEPLQSRFRYTPVWEPYSDEELGQIVAGMAARAGVDIPAEVCMQLGRAAGGTPRFAQSLVAAGRDLLSVGRPVTVEAALDLAGIDADGLTEQHAEYLRALKDLGGRAGLRNLANLMAMSHAAIEDLERLLVRRGFVRYEPNGRKLTPEGAAKVGRRAKMDRPRRRVSV